MRPLRTFIQVLRDNAVHADKATTFQRMAGDERVVPWPDLWREACRRGRALRSFGLEKGDRVALILAEPDDFVLTFIGALTAGLIAVPIYPPASLGKLEAYGDTVRHVLEASGSKLIVMSDMLRPMIESHIVASGLRIVSEVEAAGRGASDEPLGDEPSLEDIAFLQFTSGSTSTPKGVMVTYRNLAANAHAIMFDGLKSTPEDKGVSWLPLYHDMGLIGFVIAPMYNAVQVLFLPTLGFIRRPATWLEAIHRYRGTITFAPNFAFALATRAVSDAHMKDWDLSCLRAVGCGAEPIQADVLRAFADRFAPAGFRAEAFMPCYGMAEATLAISFAELMKPLVTDKVDAAAMRTGKAAAASAGASVELVGCGVEFPGHEVAIMSPDGAKLGEREVGEIWLRGPSVTAGYYRNEEATAGSFTNGWLKTGDLAYRARGQIFICGRAKDLIILNGKNYFPQDVELVAQKPAGVRPGQVIAFSRLSAASAEEVVIVAEPREDVNVDELASAVKSAVRAECGFTPAEVVFVRKGTLPKTSSGKVKRRETKRRLETNELERFVSRSARAAASAAAAVESASSTAV